MTTAHLVCSACSDVISASTRSFATKINTPILLVAGSLDKVVSVEADRSQTRWTYGQLDSRIRRLASAFEALGIERGEAVGTFAWNNHRHHELYWATANSGRVCHTINIRLFADQIAERIDVRCRRGAHLNTPAGSACAACAPAR